MSGQILTYHVLPKGSVFELNFSCGLITRNPIEDQEDFIARAKRDAEIVMHFAARETYSDLGTVVVGQIRDLLTKSFRLTYDLEFKQATLDIKMTHELDAKLLHLGYYLKRWCTNSATPVSTSQQRPAERVPSPRRRARHMEPPPVKNFGMSEAAPMVLVVPEPIT